MDQFETEFLTRLKKPEVVEGPAEKWIDRVRQWRFLDKLILDLDSSVSETYGRRKRHG